MTAGAAPEGPSRRKPSPLRIAVLGVGSLGQHHARILSDLDGVSLVGVIDPDASRAAEIAGKYGCPVLAPDHAPASLDGVVIAAPTPLHRELSVRYLRAGVGVLCEKPMATTLAECDAILEARRGSSTPLLVGHIEHFNPAVQAMASLVRNPRFLEVHRLGVFVGRSLDVDVILDLMIHDIEIAQSLVGQPVDHVEAVGVQVLTPFIDIANARLRFRGGCVANLTASRISREKVRKLRIFQPEAYLSVDYSGQEVEYYRVRGEGRERTILHEPVAVEKEEPLRRELKHFARVLRREEEPLVDGERGRDAVATARAILACMKR